MPRLDVDPHPARGRGLGHEAATAGATHADLDDTAAHGVGERRQVGVEQRATMTDTERANDHRRATLWSSAISSATSRDKS